MAYHLQRTTTELSYMPIVIQAPYNKEFDSGVLFFRKRNRRRYIKLTMANSQASQTLTYARYLFQVDYWRRGLGWIPDGYEVDHINDDRLDDRLENLQLLTSFDNNRKALTARYGHVRVSEQLIIDLGYYIQSQMSYDWIREKLRLSAGHLAYLVNQYYPDHTIKNERIFYFNKDGVRSRVEREIPLALIAQDYGVAEEVMRHYVNVHFPDYTPERILARQLEFIRSCLAKNDRVDDIADAMGADPGDVWYFIEKYQLNQSAAYAIKQNAKQRQAA